MLPDQTFAIVLVPALTKMEVKFCFFSPPLWPSFDTPKTVETGPEQREIQFKAEGPFLPSAVLPFGLFLRVAGGLLEPFF
jgi:hypothetical protein